MERRRASVRAKRAPARLLRSDLPHVRNRTKLSIRVHLRIATCRNLLMRESRPPVEESGLTLPQFDVLAELSRARAAGVTFGEISRLLLVPAGNVTGIVHRLEADGLGRRESDAR